MPKLITQLLSLTVVAVFLASLALSSPQRVVGAESTEAVQKEKKAIRLPFRGKVNSVDKTAMTITLDGKEKKRVIHVTAQTRIAKAGKPAKLEDAVVGEEVGGQAIRTADGREEAISLRLGPKPETAAKTNGAGADNDEP